MCDQREKTQGCPMYGEITQYIFIQLEIKICINVLLIHRLMLIKYISANVHN